MIIGEVAHQCHHYFPIRHQFTDWPVWINVSTNVRLIQPLPLLSFFLSLFTSLAVLFTLFTALFFYFQLRYHTLIFFIIFCFLIQSLCIFTFSFHIFILFLVFEFLPNSAIPFLSFHCHHLISRSIFLFYSVISCFSFYFIVPVTVFLFLLFSVFLFISIHWYPYSSFYSLKFNLLGKEISVDFTSGGVTDFVKSFHENTETNQTTE